MWLWAIVPFLAVAFFLSLKQSAGAGLWSNLVYRQSSIEQIVFYRKDSDNDGLRDWEEGLWRTNPHHIDSDGDGVIDGEELVIGRDPHKPSPDDLLPRDGAHELPSLARGAPITETTALTLSRLSQLVAIENVSKATGVVAGASRGGSGKTSGLSMDSLNIVDNSGPEELKRYGIELANVLQYYTPMTPAHMYQTILDAVYTQDERDLVAIVQTQKSQERVLLELLSMDVPRAAQKLHENLIHAFVRVSLDLRTIEKIFKSPTSALSGTYQYEFDYKKLLESFVAVNEFFSGQNIIFSSTDRVTF